MRLILTRHGETVENQNNILQGHLPGKLNANGLEQAKKLAKRLSSENIDVIYSSDLDRATDTAAEISKLQDFAPLYLQEEIRETDMGPYTGKSRDKVDFKNPPEDIESCDSLYARAKQFWDRICDIHMDDTVVIVGHKGINKMLKTVILGKDIEYFKNSENPGNTSITIFKVKGNCKAEIVLDDCIAHLN